MGAASHRITLATAPGQAFDSAADEPLLDAALRAGLPLAHGCRSGHCGRCRATAVDAAGARTELLLCQHRASGPLTLHCDLVAALAGQARRRLPVRVAALDLLAPDVMRLVLQPPAGQGLDALPGQSLDVVLRGGLRRSYSIARQAGPGEPIELQVRLVPGGLFTSQVFGAMRVGDSLRVEGPGGSFFHRADSLRPMLLLATGTGFAPIQAIVEAELAGPGTRPIELYWGGRQPADLYLDALCRSWAARHPRLRYGPVLSGAGQGPADRRGHVQDLALRDQPDRSGHEVYACGSGAMIAAARAALQERGGLPEAHFHSDAFSAASTPPAGAPLALT